MPYLPILFCCLSVLLSFCHMSCHVPYLPTLFWCLPVLLSFYPAVFQFCYLSVILLLIFLTLWFCDILILCFNNSNSVTSTLDARDAIASKNVFLCFRRILKDWLCYLIIMYRPQEFTRSVPLIMDVVVFLNNMQKYLIWCNFVSDW